MINRIGFSGSVTGQTKINLPIKEVTIDSLTDNEDPNGILCKPGDVINTPAHKDLLVLERQGDGVMTYDFAYRHKGEEAHPYLFISDKKLLDSTRKSHLNIEI